MQILPPQNHLNQIKDDPDIITHLAHPNFSHNPLAHHILPISHTINLSCHTLSLSHPHLRHPIASLQSNLLHTISNFIRLHFPKSLTTSTAKSIFNHFIPKSKHKRKTTKPNNHPTTKPTTHKANQ